MATTLTLVKVKEITGEEDVTCIKKINASKKSLTRVKDISNCSSLQKLDLSFNQLSNIKHIVTCLSLTWINLSRNLLTSLKGIGHLKNLVVLNASHNLLTDSGDMSDLKNLKALVLNNNELSVISGLSSLFSLNTLVLSHNNIASIDISSLPELTKLSLSHNQLTTVPNTKTNYLLLEIRLTANKITAIPTTIQLNTRLQIIDLGQNSIKEVKSIEAISHVKKLKNINLSGNPISSEVYRDKLIQWLPQLHVLDGAKLAKSEHKRVNESLTVINEPEISTTIEYEKEQEKEQEKVIEPHPVVVTERQPSVKKRSRGKSGVISIKTVSKKQKTAQRTPLHDSQEDIFNVNASVMSWDV